MIKSKIDKSFYILGLGISGLSTALFLKKKSKKVICWDDDNEKRKLAIENKLNVKKINPGEMSTIDYLIASPIINHRKKKNHPIIEIAKKKKIEIISDLELIYIFGITNKKIGITGTNGKSTTTKFIESSLKSQSCPTIACGNIGIPITDSIKKLKKKTILAIEASSFQLDKIQLLKFDISILLNISNDHLDWHGSFEKYVNAKLEIFRNQDKDCYAIICVDDKNCKKLVKLFPKKFKSSLIQISTQSNVDNGIYLKDSSNGIKIYNNLSSEVIFFENKLIKFTKVKHNLQNFLAAYATCYLLNKDKNFKSSFNRIVNLEHRLELVKEFKRIHFYNDSKATNIESTKSALNSFKNIFWILGGRKKTGGLKGIENSLGNVLHAFCYGECAKEFYNFLKKKSIKVIISDNLESALKEAVTKSLIEKKRINIVFSPACSSFDQFQNFEHRGRKFKSLVSKIVRNGKP